MKKRDVRRVVFSRLADDLENPGVVARQLRFFNDWFPRR